MLHLTAQQDTDVFMTFAMSLLPLLFHLLVILRLSVVGRGRDVATTAGPVDVDVLANLVLLVGELRLDAEGVGTEVVTLGLEEVGGEVLGTVTVVEGQSGAEAGSGDTPEGALGDNVSPALLCVVDGLVEEVVEEEVLEVGVAAVGGSDVLEEDGADDAATAPHEGDLGLVELPAVLLGGLHSRVSLLLQSSEIAANLRSA